MAVLIEGINRPTEPRKCKFFDIDPLGVRKPFCAIQSVCDGLESCPLIEIPQHGRLIDADRLKRNITANLPIAVQDLCPSFCNIVDMQKTVIDGSGDE